MSWVGVDTHQGDGRPCVPMGAAAGGPWLRTHPAQRRPPAPAQRSEALRCVARTALRTKLYEGLADRLTDIVVDAVLTIKKEDQPLDLYMVRAAALRRACQEGGWVGGRGCCPSRGASAPGPAHGEDCWVLGAGVAQAADRHRGRARCRWSSARAKPHCCSDQASLLCVCVLPRACFLPTHAPAVHPPTHPPHPPTRQVEIMHMRHKLDTDTRLIR